MSMRAPLIAYGCSVVSHARTLQNIEEGRYLKRRVSSSQAPCLQRGRDRYAAILGDYLFCAKKGGPICILKYSEGVCKVRSLEGFKCYGLSVANDKVYVLSGRTVFELDFSSPEASTHLGDLKVVSTIQAIFLAIFR